MISLFSNFPGIDLEERMKNLQCHMSLMADNIKNMTALLFYVFVRILGLNPAQNTPHG